MRINWKQIGLLAFVSLMLTLNVVSASYNYIMDDLQVLGGDIVAGNSGLSPASAVLQKGTLTVQPAGNSTYGDLRFQIKTAGGVTYTNTLHGGITQAADLDWTWPIAYPAGTYALTSTTGGVMGFAAFGTGTVGGSGTDNHVVRWDGTGNIQDSGWVIDDNDALTINSTLAEIRVVSVIADFLSGTISGDSDPSIQLFSASGTGAGIELGDGSGAADVFLKRGAANRLDLNGSSIFNLNNASGQILVNAANPRRSIMLRAYEMWPSTTAPAIGPTVTEMTTNKQNLQLIAFQGVAGKVYAEFTTPMPDNWDGGSVYATFYWTANNANTSGVRWGLECRSYGDAETIDQAWGTAQEVTDTESGTAVQNLISAETAAITPAGTPAGGELLQCRVYRDASHGDDAELGSVDLIAIKLEYTVSQFGE